MGLQGGLQLHPTLQVTQGYADLTQVVAQELLVNLHCNDSNQFYSDLCYIQALKSI